MFDNLDSDMVKLVLACLGLLSTLLSIIYYLLRQVSSVRLEVRRVGEKVEEVVQSTETTWIHMLRRGELEAEAMGYITSDGQVAQHVIGHFAGILKDMQEYAHGPAKFLPMTELAVEIERRWGQRMVEWVCRPLNIRQGACLVLALRLCQLETLHLIHKSEAGGEGPATPQGGGG